ncbi:Tubulin-folding cofactor C like [Actinidia chinensis var. chinensis]|uniref:Tubulin-folding cofactor C like n=1 Tax=Actinidia chinensis var. chinensis TaxID=1590841 RepID=A0A2R6S393_ACTCC|nr:Tubulin-folding cofactor C like [Actinidia chinensis var. chinensis]
MLERLANRKQSLSSRKPASNTDSFESTHSFLSRFSQSKLSIDSDLARSVSKSDLDRVSISISDLEKLVAENSYFLPSYEVRTCLKTISDLKQTVENVPKKKFGFKNKKASTGVVPEIEPEIQAFEPEKLSYPIRESPGFREKENEVLVKEFEGLQIDEFTISDLNSCEVLLKGCLRALFVHRLRNCKVYVGSVFGSVLIEDVEGCVFVLASHQIRVHHARWSDFYLRVSRPIIEDCNGV